MNFNTLLFICFVFILSSCGSEDGVEENQNTTKVETQEDLIERMPNMYREFYPGKKQIKVTGPLDKDGNRHGAWESYFENGIKNSATYYINGVREGHSIVYHPNGAVYYYGEYKNDQKSGLWKTFNEKGELISEDVF